MKKTKLNTKKPSFLKKLKENPVIKQGDFQELLRRASVSHKENRLLGQSK